MKKKVLVFVLCMVFLMSGCKAYEVIAPEETPYSEQETNTMDVKAVGSYHSLYGYLDQVMEKQKNNGYGYDEIDRKDIKYSTSSDSAVQNSMAADTGKGSSGSYGKTNVMTEGIDEGDILKNDGNYLYFYEYDTQQCELRIVKVDGKNMDTVSTIHMDTNKNVMEFYLCQDQIILIQGDFERNRTEAVFYDITDRKNPKYEKTIMQDGGCLASRMDQEHLYLITEKYNDYVAEVTNESCVPAVDGCKVKADCIYVPEEPETKNFVTCTSVSLGGTKEVKSSISVLCTGNYFYMSDQNMYLCNTFWDDIVAKTEIMRISAEDGILKMKAKGTVNGYQPDSFCINEYNGCLRLVMMQNMLSGSQAADAAEEDISVESSQMRTFSALYVLDMDLDVTGEVSNIAEGEQVYSVRFMGDRGYFVTFRSIDPLFSADLSNPKNPVIIGELKIPGFSEYLHPYSGDLLLGIGFDVEENHRNGIKLSMFNIEDPASVTEEQKKILTEYEYSECMYDYNSLCIDREKNIFGFSCEKYTDEAAYMEYVICSYDKENGFTVHKTVSEDRMDVNTIRGTFVGDTFYTISYNKQIVATDLNTMEELGVYQFG